MRELNPDERLWCDFVNALDERQQQKHDKDQAISIQAFEAGLAAGRAEPDLRLRMLYIGAVSLLCSVYVTGDVEDDDSVERLAKDFNAQGYGLEMCRAGGKSGWGIFQRPQDRQETSR